MNTLRIFLMAFVLSTGLAMFSPSASAQQVSVSLSVFQNDLAPYGRWINSPRYGQVWSYSEPGFRPYYSNGHWEYSDYGWAWVSDYDWGWAPFHYGRWEEDPYYGWVWIPGYEWAPAWVSWSEYDGNYGWAPLGFGLNMNVSFGAIPFNRWAFVPRANICSPNLHDYYLNTRRSRGFRNAVVINNVYVNNNVRFYAGPRRGDVERYTRSVIPVRSINYGRPQRYAGNDRNRDNHYNNRPERPGRNDMPGRVNEQPRSSGTFGGRDNNPGRSSDRFPDRNNAVERPSAGFRDRNDRNDNNRSRNDDFRRPDRSERAMGNPYSGADRNERTERSGSAKPRGFGNTEMHRAPEMRQQQGSRPQERGGFREQRSENNRGENHGRSGRRV